MCLLVVLPKEMKARDEDARFHLFFSVFSFNQENLEAE